MTAPKAKRCAGDERSATRPTRSRHLPFRDRRQMAGGSRGPLRQKERPRRDGEEGREEGVPLQNACRLDRDEAECRRVRRGERGLVVMRARRAGRSSRRRSQSQRWCAQKTKARTLWETVAGERGDPRMRAIGLDSRCRGQCGLGPGSARETYQQADRVRERIWDCRERRTAVITTQ